MTSLQSTYFNINNVHFKYHKLGDLLEKIVGGGTPSKSKSEYWNGSIPWASVKDMADGVYQLHSTIDSITEDGVKNSATNVIPKGTVVISTRMGLGRCFKASIDVAINQDLKALFTNELTLPEYLIWLMVHLGKQIENMGTGTTVKGIRLEQLRDLDVYLPSPPTQQKIASILSAYDDLIENNIRRIKILEEMIQTIYNEWFVKFKFPGRENSKMVESELGMIPDGWEVTTLSKVTNYINRGIAPKYDDESSSLVINQRCIRDNKINLETARRHNGKVTSEKYVQFGDVLINSTGVGTLGRVAQLCEKIDNYTVDTHVSIVRPSGEVELYYFGIALQQLESYFESQGEGATGQTELRRDRIGQTLLLMPPISLQRLFSTFVSPKRQIINILLQKNKRLCETRDLLLPRLISGEIDVSELDIDVGGITA